MFQLYVVKRRGKFSVYAVVKWYKLRCVTIIDFNSTGFFLTLFLKILHCSLLIVH